MDKKTEQTPAQRTGWLRQNWLLLLTGFLVGAAAVQYFRPEIVGIVLGSLLMALARREFKGKGGSAPALRFGLGGLRELTQKEVAQRLGISQSYISRLEKRILEKLRADITHAWSA